VNSNYKVIKLINYKNNPYCVIALFEDRAIRWSKLPEFTWMPDVFCSIILKSLIIGKNFCITGALSKEEDDDDNNNNIYR
jgi:hypothetical protein